MKPISEQCHISNFTSRGRVLNAICAFLFADYSLKNVPVEISTFLSKELFPPNNVLCSFTTLVIPKVTIHLLKRIQTSNASSLAKGLSLSTRHGQRVLFSIPSFCSQRSTFQKKDIMRGKEWQSDELQDVR